MMHSLALVYAVSAPLLLGLSVLALLGIRWRSDRLAVLASGWLTGCLLLGAIVQACLEVGLPPRWWWPVPLLVVGSLEFVRRRRAPSAPDARATPVGLGFGCFVAAGCLFSLWFALAGMDRPCIEGDEGNIWSLKAKSLLVDLPDHFAAAQVWNLHPDYPQLNPLLQSWVYALTGVPDFVQFENRWLVQLCSVALFVAVAAALRHRLRALPAAALSLLVLLEPEFQNLCRTAYADGMVALGLVVALDAFLRWRADQRPAHAWLAGFGLAFALWSKNETMLYVASLGAAALIARVALRRPMPWQAGAIGLIAVPLAVIANTALWNRRFGMNSDLLGANPTGKSMFQLMAEQWPERVPALLAEAGRMVASLEHAHAVFALLLLAMVLVPRAAFGQRLAVPTIALGLAVTGLHVVYVGSFLPLRMHLDTSHLRVLFQLVPVTVVWLAAVISEVVAARRGGQTAEAA